MGAREQLIAREEENAKRRVRGEAPVPQGWEQRNGSFMAEFGGVNR